MHHISHHITATALTRYKCKNHCKDMLEMMVKHATK